MIDLICLVTITVLNAKVGEFENKIPNFSYLMITTVLNTKIVEAENKYEMLVV